MPSAKGGALRRKSSHPLSAVLLIGKMVEVGRAVLGRAEGIGWVEAIGAEPRNVGQENFVGRKIFRRRTSRLAATLPAVAVSEERGTGNDFSRRFRVRQIERLMPMRVQDWTNTGFLSPACRRFRM